MNLTNERSNAKAVKEPLLELSKHEQRMQDCNWHYRNTKPQVTLGAPFPSMQSCDDVVFQINVTPRTSPDDAGSFIWKAETRDWFTETYEPIMEKTHISWQQQIVLLTCIRETVNILDFVYATFVGVDIRDFRAVLGAMLCHANYLASMKLSQESQPDYQPFTIDHDSMVRYLRYYVAATREKIQGASSVKDAEFRLMEAKRLLRLGLYFGEGDPQGVEAPRADGCHGGCRCQH